MGHEYWLIKKITTIGHNNPIQIVDKTNAKNIKDAEEEFKSRNNFKTILRKAGLTIAKSERWIQ